MTSSTVLTSALWAAIAALPLLLGAWIALARRPSNTVLGLVAAFGAGALISAVSFELVEDAAGIATPTGIALALAAGAVTYFIGDRLLSRRAETAGGGRARGLALLLGATLDGIPESFILGISTASGGGVGIAFFVAVLVSNFPEGMASAAELKGDPDMPKRRILGMWVIVIAASAAAAALGALATSLPRVSGAFAQSFAAGALLTMLVDDLIPEARELGGLSAGLAAVFGFAVAFGLHQIG